MSSGRQTARTRSAQRIASFLRSGWLPSIHRRLSQVLETAKTIPFDDSSRFVFFSDLHRGDRSRSDSFLPNARLFLHALTHYERSGFTYIEVGDGDELWKGWPFDEIRVAHQRIFDLLHHLSLDRRLHLVVGNHDLNHKPHDQAVKDGLLAHEGLVLQHHETGQRLFVVHGHQADITNDRLYFLARRAVRFGHRLRDLAVQWYQREPQMGKLEQRIIDWVREYQQIVICGHTHRAAFPKSGGPPYFNTGSCIVPGSITGLELRNGALVPIRWTERAGVRFIREQSGPPKRLNW